MARLTHSSIGSNLRWLMGAALVAMAAGAAIGMPGAAVGAATTKVTTSAYSGFASGSVVYANALNLQGNPVVAKAEVANSAAAVAENGGTLRTTDSLGQPQLLSVSATGKTAYGHGSGVNVGLFTSQAATPSIKLSTAEHTSPPPGSGVPSTDEVLAIPASPIASVHVLPSHAQSNTTTTHVCVPAGTPISEGDAHAANADILTAGTTTVATLAATSDSTSTTALAAPTTAGGAALSAPGQALVTQTTQAIAPVKLFAGSPAEIDITVLKPLALTAAAGGVAGSAHITYGFAGATPTTPVLSIKVGTTTQTLTSQQLLGSSGLKIGLGIADVTIGTPAHAFGGLETTSPAVAANGTSASASSDLVRVTSPGTLPLGASSNGPLAQLVSGLNTAVTGLGPLLTPIQSGLASALGVADVRVGHIDVQSKVPVGGVVCSGGHPAPFNEASKDASSATVSAGDTFSYTVRFPNRGDLPVTNVKVVDTFTGGPPPLEFVSSTPAPSSTSGNTLTYLFGTLQPGEYASITLTFRVPANAPNGTVYHNSATISGTYDGATVTKTVIVDQPTTVNTGPPGCNLAYSTKYASNKQVVTGEKFAYYVDVLNAGGTTCTGVEVKDTLTSGVSFVSCTMNCTHSGQDVAWSLGDLEPGASKVVQVVVKVTATSGHLPNTADITSTNGGSGHPSTPGPEVTTTSVVNPANPPACPDTVCSNNTSNSPLPNTGVMLRLAPALLCIVAGAGLLLRQRRRPATR